VVVVINAGVATDGQFADKQPCEHREKVPNVEGHDRKHTEVRNPVSGWSTYRGVSMEHLQQVREASIECEQARARQIGTESPRYALHVAPRGPHNLDSLVQALGRQNSLFSLLATATYNSPFAIRFVLPRDHDISAVHSAVVPLLFNEVAIG